MDLVAADAAGWSARFAREAATVRRIAPAAAVEHVGSTAIGIEGKDVVDVLLGVQPGAHTATVAGLVGAGYILEGSRSTAEGERHTWLTRLVEDRRVTVLHVVDAAGAEWRRRTAFRDALRRDAALRAEYVDLKRAIAADTDDWGEYTAHKAAFVRRVLDDCCRD